MVRQIIFDLSEVLIAGLLGIEKPLSRELSLPEAEIPSRFLGSLLEELLLGDISEEAYLRTIIERESWPVEIARLRQIILANFHREVEGSLAVLTSLDSKYELSLHSDHVREWISYIRSVHPFMQLFHHAFFSYELGRLKHDPQAFLIVLEQLAASPQDCLFIDDNPKNIQAAQSVGLPCICFRNAQQLRAELSKLHLLD